MLRFLPSIKKLFAIFFVALLFELGFEYFTSLSIQYLIDDAITPRNFTVFYALLLALLVGGILSLVIGVWGDYAMSKLTETILLGLRSDVYRQTQTLSANFYTRYRIGDIVARFSTDIPTVEHALIQLLSVGLLSIFSIIIGSALLFTLEWKLSLIAIVGIALMFLPQKLLSKRAQRFNEQYLEVVESFSNHMDEEMKAYRVIRGFQLQQAMQKRFMKQMQKWFHLGVRKRFIDSNMERLPIMMLSVLNAVILGVGGYLTFQGHMTVGELIAFYSVFDTLGIAVITFMEIVPSLIEGEVCMRRINEILDIKPDLEEPRDAVLKPAIEHEIRFADVSFGYTEAKPVLHALNVSIPVGKYVAFVGPSGSGKSTLLQLLMRFYDPHSGSIELDGKDMRDVQMTAIMQQVGVIFQEPFLFHTSIRENLRLGSPNLTEEELYEAARAVDVHESILQMPEGYDTLIENEGANLSVSQRHKISIARALLRATSMLFLDEVAASLDPESELALNETIARESQGRTVVAVSNRMKTIAQADLIYFMLQGRIVESGTHEELMAKQGKYYEVWRKQQGFNVNRHGGIEMEAERLQQLPFFQLMNLAMLEEIKGLLSTEAVSSGQYICKQDESGDKFYVIARGKVGIYKRKESGEKEKVAVLEDGDHFGEIALLRNVPRTADVVALTDCLLLTLTRKQIMPLLEKYGDMKEMLEHSLSQRI